MKSIIEKKMNILLIFLSILAIFLAVYGFTSTPKVWVDEGVFTDISRNLAHGGKLGIQISPNNIYEVRGWLLSTGYTVIYPVALCIKLFGIGIWQARLPMIIYILLFLLVFYLFVREKYGGYAAFISTLLMLSFSPLYGNGRPVQGEVPGLFFLIFGAYLLSLLEKKLFKDRKLAIFTGLVFGLSCATKALYLTFIPISLFVVFLVWFKKIEDKKILFYFVLGLIPPIFLWFIIHFPTRELMSHFISSYFYLAGNHISGSSTIFTIYNNFIRFFTEATPLLFSFVSFFILFSIYIRLKKQNDNSITFAESLIYIFIFLNWLGYLNGTGWYRYFFPAHVLLYTVFVGSTLSLANYFKNVFVIKLLYIIPVVLLIFQFYHLVFLSDTSFVVNRTRNAELARVLGSIPKDKSVLFYNSIEAVVFFKSHNYSQYLEMDDFLVAGDKNALSKPGPDYILTDKSQYDNMALHCYKEKPLSQYFFLERISNCRK